MLASVGRAVAVTSAVRTRSVSQQGLITFLAGSPSVWLGADAAEAASSLLTLPVVLAGIRGARVI